MSIELIAFSASVIILGIASLLFIWAFFTSKPAQAGPGASYHAAEKSRFQSPGFLAILGAIIGLLALTVSITARTVDTGHGPFTGMYEFAISFSWGIVLMGLYFEWRYRATAVSAIGVIIAFGLLLYANTMSSKAAPLVPALQQSFLLTVHVAAAVIAYGSLTIGFGAAILYLIQERTPSPAIPDKEILDSLSYRTVLIGFPALTLVIVLGAIWADVAWGRYWSWDPKETASLVTWLVYAGYLHARVLRGWSGSRSAMLLIIGFLAIIFTFFGNYIFQGLHSYG